MDDLNALFDSVEGLSEELKDRGTIALAAIGSAYVWNYALNRFVPASLFPGDSKKYVVPVAALVTGIYAGRKIGRYTNHRVATGVTVGLAIVGVAGLLAALMPGFSNPLALAGYGGLYGAPVTYEDMGGGVSGGPITVEETGPGVADLGYGGGYAAVAS